MESNQSQEKTKLGKRGASARAAAAALGISHPALLKAHTAGRVPRFEDGSFDIAACRSALEANTNPQKSRIAREQADRTDQPAPMRQEGLISESDQGMDVESFPAAGSLADASRELEWLRVKQARLRTAREEGRLVELSPVNAFVAGMIMRVRDELMRLAMEMRDALAMERDPIRCEEILQDKFRNLLGTMSEYRPASASTT